MLMMLNQLISPMKMSNIKLLIFLSFLFRFFNSAKAQNIMLDVVYLKSDTTIKGRLIQLIPNESVSIIDLNDSLHFISLNNVEIIKKELSIYKPNDLSKQKYFSIGGTIGFPAVINLRGSYTSKNHCFGLSGNYFHILNGVQVNYTYLLSNNYRFTHGPSLFAGLNYTKDLSTNYINRLIYYGFGYQFSYKILFSELGYGLFQYDRINSSYIAQGMNFQLGVIFKLVEKEFKEKHPKDFMY